MCNKIKRELYATDCKCFEIKSNTVDQLLCFGCQMFKKWPFKLGRMYQTAHQNDGFNALWLCCSKLNPACLCYDSKPAKQHKARGLIQLLNHLLRLPDRASSHYFQERSRAMTLILKLFPYRIINLLNVSSVFTELWAFLPKILKDSRLILLSFTPRHSLACWRFELWFDFCNVKFHWFVRCQMRFLIG